MWTAWHITIYANITWLASTVSSLKASAMAIAITNASRGGVGVNSSQNGSLLCLVLELPKSQCNGVFIIIDSLLGKNCDMFACTVCVIVQSGLLSMRTLDYVFQTICCYICSGRGLMNLTERCFLVQCLRIPAYGFVGHCTMLSFVGGICLQRGCRFVGNILGLSGGCNLCCCV